MLIFGSIIVIFEHLFSLPVPTFASQNPLIINYYATTKKNCIFPSLVCRISLYAQQNCFISSYVRGNFYNRGRISAESLRRVMI